VWGGVDIKLGPYLRHNRIAGREQEHGAGVLLLVPYILGERRTPPNERGRVLIYQIGEIIEYNNVKVHPKCPLSPYRRVPRIKYPHLAVTVHLRLLQRMMLYILEIIPNRERSALNTCRIVGDANNTVRDRQVAVEHPAKRIHVLRSKMLRHVGVWVAPLGAQDC
jgi:hypothetical protein